MSHPLISHSPDLKRLRDEGYEVFVKNNYLIISGIPYVNSCRGISSGILVSELTLSGNRTARPKTHVVHFAGERPCHSNGSVIEQIWNSSSDSELFPGFKVNHMFSNTPSGGYENYYDKITQYVMILENEAKAIDDNVSARTGRIPESDVEDTVFCYPDTNSSRSEINSVIEKLKNQKIAIVGLGGTGSYVLDFVAKTPVDEIHLYDNDKFLVHNAFRAPGAPTREELNNLNPKVDYLNQIYSRMHKGIVSHPEHLNESNVEHLATMDFVFLCIDNGAAKPIIIKVLEKHDVDFTDVGMGIILVKEDSSLVGQIRTTTSTKKMRQHIHDRQLISFEDGDDDNQYSTNIQIAELNAFNAAMAVIKWKKTVGFYQDLVNEHHSIYSINDNLLDYADEA